jgi:glycosyltransferase involved in cell wall biosynthesis
MISVVLPLRDRADVIERALHSVLEQTMPELEVIVVDHGSSDDGPLRVARLRDERLRIVREGSLAKNAARNFGARLARGQHLCFLAPDEAWRVDKLALQLTALAAHPELGAVGSMWFSKDSPAGGSTGELLRGDAVLELVLRGQLPLGSLLLTRAAWDALGGFDESLSFAAGWELCARLCELTSVGVLDDALLLRFARPPHQAGAEHAPHLDRAAEATLARIFRTDRALFKNRLQARALGRRARGDLERKRAERSADAADWIGVVRHAVSATLSWPPNALSSAEQIAKVLLRRS